MKKKDEGFFLEYIVTIILFVVSLLIVIYIFSGLF